MRITQALAPHDNSRSVVRPEYLSHGTVPSYELAATRRFYEEFLGLECVRHGRSSMAVRCGMRFHVVCLEVGELLRPASVDNHWGLDVDSAERVDEVWRAAHELRHRYGIRTIGELTTQHGVYSFYLEDLDHNWWEVQYYDGTQHDDMFDFGDRFSGSDLHGT
ncbi:VOC family protein [Ramlibacter sp. AW1]|uniref:VOC family protein n=1 Tax=Ramlibacter aurantiacus TaxID=2801330 RepID=A0A936ZQJ4_9BURK|nr:VOC family protein [Ramlibacter aurantiacus]MBL0421876.1 VOC family protein [Ramlibacter aurantiacus]